LLLIKLTKDNIYLIEEFFCTLFFIFICADTPAMPSPASECNELKDGESLIKTTAQNCNLQKEKRLSRSQTASSLS